MKHKLLILIFKFQVESRLVYYCFHNHNGTTGCCQILMSLRVENRTLLILCVYVQLCSMLVRSGVGLTCESHLQCLHHIYRPMIPLFLDGMGI